MQSDLIRKILNEDYAGAASSLEMSGSLLTVPARNRLTQACQAIADTRGFGQAVESVIGLSRQLGFLLADPERDALKTVRIPLTGGAVGRLESNPRRAERGSVATLTRRGIINPGAPDESWMYEQWTPDRKGTAVPLDENRRGWGTPLDGSVKCFLCSGLGEGRTSPVNPNEIFISCPGPDGAVYAGCNFAALAPHHMTAFQREITQQRVDRGTIRRTLAILENLQKGADGGAAPFVVIHNGDLTCSRDAAGKVRTQGAGATLLHEHNQFMRADLPIMKAATAAAWNRAGVRVSIVDWASSVIRAEWAAAQPEAGVRAADAVVKAWQDRNERNTVNLIATHDGRGTTVLFIALRRIGLADAPEKPCVASLEEAGIIVLDDEAVYAKYAAASPSEALQFLKGVLEFVDPVLKDSAGDRAAGKSVVEALATSWLHQPSAA